MKRTKPRAENTLSRGLKNSSTQTDNSDSQIEIAKLEEQVRLLHLEIDVLRKHTGRQSDKGLLEIAIANQRPVQLTPNATLKTAEKYNCGCKGNCSSRCGCVKKNYSCNPSCKCNGKLCQNQKSKDNQENQENKENVNETDITPRNQRKKNEDMGDRKSLFSPETTRNHYEGLAEDEFSDIHFSFDGNDTNIKNTQTNVFKIIVNDAKLEIKKQDEKEENAQKQQEFPETVVFKPRRELSRTPPKNLEKSLEKSGHQLSPEYLEKLEKPKRQLLQIPKNPEKQFEKPILQATRTSPRNQKSSEKPILQSLRTPRLEVESTQSYSKSTQKMTNKFPCEFQDIKEEQVDWQEHTSQLIACKKCKRTFRPDRIKKHEACCKKI